MSNFKLRLFDPTELIVATFGCKDIGIRKSEVVAKTQFLSQGFHELYIIDTYSEESRLSLLDLELGLGFSVFSGFFSFFCFFSITGSGVAVTSTSISSSQEGPHGPLNL